jgi:hypothetical protein
MQELYPEMTSADWDAYCRDPHGLPCLVSGCGRPSRTELNPHGETVVWTGCGHRAYWPEEGPTKWPDGMRP